MNKLFIFVFIGLIASIHCLGTSCGGNASELRISGCKEEPCVFKRGSTGTIEVDFKASGDSKTLTGEITANIMNRNVGWPGYDKNACSNSNIECPIKANSNLTYRYKYKVLSLYPRVSPTVTIKLMNDKNNLEACYKIKIKIQ